MPWVTLCSSSQDPLQIPRKTSFVSWWLQHNCPALLRVEVRTRAFHCLVSGATSSAYVGGGAVGLSRTLYSWNVAWLPWWLEGGTYHNPETAMAAGSTSWPLGTTGMGPCCRSAYPALFSQLLNQQTFQTLLQLGVGV